MSGGAGNTLSKIAPGSEKVTGFVKNNPWVIPVALGVATIATGGAAAPLLAAEGAGAAGAAGAGAAGLGAAEAAGAAGAAGAGAAGAGAGLGAAGAADAATAGGLLGASSMGGGVGTGAAGAFGPTAQQAGLLGAINGGGSSVPMVTAGEGLGQGAAGAGTDMAALGAPNSALGQPSLLAQAQGFVRPGGPLNTGLNYYQKANTAMNMAGMGQQRPAAMPAAQAPGPSSPAVPSSQIFANHGITNPNGPANSAGYVGGTAGRGQMDPQLLALLLRLRGQA